MDKTFEDYIDMAQSLIDQYDERNTMYKNMETMFNYEWKIPAGTPEWFLKVVSTDPRDAVMTTVRTFATVKPKFKIAPMLPNPENKQRANDIETALAWNFYRAGRRSPSTLEWDVMFSAALYADVAAQVIYLPYQEKVYEAMGRNTARLKAMKRKGDFAFIVHNPGNVYPTWSEYGLESVMTVRTQTLDEFKAAWGTLAEKLAQDPDQSLSYVTVFDYVDYETRTVWAVLSELNELTLEGAGQVILDEENTLGFIPFAMARWGNNLTTDTDKTSMPLLQSVYGSGQYDMLNFMDSMDLSLTLKRAAAARFAGEFPAGTAPVVDNRDPDGTLHIPPGTQNFTPLPGQSVDHRLATNKLEFKSRIWQGTVAKALQTLEFPSGTAYSSVNQILSTAANSLASYRMLGEYTLAEMAHQMLCWVKYYGKEYGTVDFYGQYEDKGKEGKEVRIGSDTIDPDEMDIKVILTADMPVDKLQQINGAVLVKNNFKVPEADLLEDLGYGNPPDLRERRDLEDYENIYIQTDLKRIADAQALETAAQQMQLQMGIQQQAQAQDAEEQANAAAANNEAPANENLGGPGFNNNGGGTPPVQGARGQGRG